MAETITYNGGRYYVIREKEDTYYLPSVTTIIGESKDDTWLQDWYNRIGEEKAKAISKFSANRGTVMHAYCEHYFTDNDILKRKKLEPTLTYTYDWAIKEGFSEEEITCGRNLFYNFYNSGFFNEVEDIVMLEQRLYSLLGGGYAGRVDKIYKDKKGRVIIADYKTSKTSKKDEWIEGYKMQISAYYVAYWQMFNIKPSHGEIWISNEQDTIPQMFIVTYDAIKEYYKKFLDAVKSYHKKYGKVTPENIKL